LQKKDDSFKIHAVINTYNDHVALPFALDSVKDVVDSIIVADGAYDLYYKTYHQIDKRVKPWSTDGTLEMLSIFKDMPPIKLIECPNGKPWPNQIVKRNALVDAVPDKDWFLILDSDEMFYGDVVAGVNEIMTSGCISGRVPLYNVGLEIEGWIPFWHPRVYLKLPGMHYKRKHWLLCDADDRMIPFEYPVWATNAFVLAHLKIFRDHRRIYPHEQYMLKLAEHGWVEPKENQIKLGKPDEPVDPEMNETEVNLN